LIGATVNRQAAAGIESTPQAAKTARGRPTGQPR
jgi:hypothetical protein